MATSKSFKDINLSFKRHPVTNDVVVLKDEDAIKRSVHNIILTITGEKPFLDDCGTIINESLFELTTSVNSIAVEKQITASLNRYEPRIEIDDVTIDINPDEQSMYAKVQYTITGGFSQGQSVDVLLFPARV